MDIADDIAYATYDLEDAFKAGFVTPIDLLSLKQDEELLNELVRRINKENINLSGSEIIDKLYEIFGGIFSIDERADGGFSKGFGVGFNSITSHYIETLTRGYIASRFLAQDGFDRSNFTSFLIDRFISGIDFFPNEERPPLSNIGLNDDIKIEVEVLKSLSFLLLINSSRVKVAEYRGYEIIQKIFEALIDDQKEGHKLLPEDFRNLYLLFKDNDDQKKRVVCDFIAGMTDRYAIEFYGRLYSENPETIFKSL
ncbi:MAG: hypothetical protein JXJ04_22360 [Spirochaetales bacterium]|nr:hypothetical protein [Spirochaetales bacterium]